MKIDLKPFFPYEEPAVPRKGQLEIVDEIIDAFERYDYVLLNAPPGVGKSLIGMTLANYYRSKQYQSYILTTEKILQKQYFDDFKKFEYVCYLAGKNNYLCVNKDLPPDTPYENGICHLLPKGEEKDLDCYSECPYKNARSKAKEHSITISNYHYMLIDQDYLPEFSKMPSKWLTIYDEAHNLEKILLDYTVVSFPKKLLEELEKRLQRSEQHFKIELPKIQEFENLYKKLRNLPIEDSSLPHAIAQFSRLNALYEKTSEKLSTTIKLEVEALSRKFYTAGMTSEMYKSEEFKKAKYGKSFVDNLNQLSSKITSMLENLEGSLWIFDKNESEESVELKPVFATYLFRSSLDKLSRKKLFMSGTLSSKKVFCKTFGLKESQVCYLTMPSVFPVENRKIYNLPLANMSYRTLQQGMKDGIGALDDIIQTHPGMKMLVHSGTYQITKHIQENSKFKKLMFVPTSDTRQENIESFKNSKRGILVSPSMMEGLSLDDDQCRVQVIFKVPYPSLGDRRIKIRASIDPEWYSQQTVNKIVQGSGRGVRHEEDYCTTYIIDSCFEGLLSRSRELFPVWYLEAIFGIQDYLSNSERL